MNNSEEIILTSEGFAKLIAELDNLKHVKRGEVSERIRQSLVHSDDVESSDYGVAKNEQVQIENRITQIEKILKSAKVIADEEVNTDRVNIGTKVKILDLEYNEEEEYSLVGLSEGNPIEKKISYQSPVGFALLGRVVGDIVEVEVPVGIMKYKILQISK